MPYIITTASPPPPPDHSHSGNIIAKRAVNTLDTKEVARRLFNWREGDALDAREVMIVGVISSLPEQGGTTNPLPDGTVIEVERLSPLMLAAHTPRFSSEALLVCTKTNDFAPLIDAYNKEHS